MGFSKIHSFCYKIRIFDGCLRKKTLNYRHMEKTNTVNPPFYCSFLMFYTCLNISAKFEKNLDNTSFSRELP